MTPFHPAGPKFFIPSCDVILKLGLCVFLCVQVSRVWLKTVPCRCQKTLSCRCCQQRSSRTNIDATSSETTLRCVSVCVCERQGSAVMAAEKAEACGRGVRTLPCFLPGVNLWISFTLSGRQASFPPIFTARLVTPRQHTKWSQHY